MGTFYIIRNQQGHYWGRGKRWVDGRDTSRVLALSHRDEAANTVFEISSRDIHLRCELLKLDGIDDKLPKLEISEHPLPEPEEDMGQAAENLSRPSPLENTQSVPISTVKPH